MSKKKKNHSPTPEQKSAGRISAARTMIKLYQQAAPDETPDEKAERLDKLRQWQATLNQLLTTQQNQNG